MYLDVFRNRNWSCRDKLMRTGFFLTIPKAPGSIHSPELCQIEAALRNEEFFDGSLADVALTYFEVSYPDVRIHRKLFFWISSSRKVACFYGGEEDLWGFSDGCSTGDDIEVDDGGGGDVVVNTRFLQSSDLALSLCDEMLKNRSLELGESWERVTFFRSA